MVVVAEVVAGVRVVSDSEVPVVDVVEVVESVVLGVRVELDEVSVELTRFGVRVEALVDVLVAVVEEVRAGVRVVASSEAEVVDSVSASVY